MTYDGIDYGDRDESDYTDDHDDGRCEACDGEGGDKWVDYCLPCKACGGSGRSEP